MRENRSFGEKIFNTMISRRKCLEGPMVLILDGNSGHVAHASKIGFFGEKIKCLKQIK